ncbi:hypothetical protein HHK36_012152 [Tetracentron sinense]|uniref:NYN domain-containing protein n=1 Tax=Tetracentron sinense TaxID=13715 RepID=A0A835DEB8_TETSI|nr:hypothetical protein HHK36_012152 [Tetracentron sinense]
MDVLICTGVKDASDKKILVDMLFWAVDNPAPANYLLISGDRDFSNALHQLRMRRYNILLAQPQKASAPLLAAAKSVWLWTSLLAGGPPLAKDESPELGNNNYASNSSTSVKPNISRTSSVPFGIQEILNNGNSHQPRHAKATQIKGAPHEFFGAHKPTTSSCGPTPNLILGNPDPSWNNNNNLPGNYQHHSLQPSRSDNLPMQPTSASGNFFPPNSHIHGFRPMHPKSPDLTNTHDIGKLYPYEYLSISQYPPSFQQQNGELKSNSIFDSPHHASLNTPQGHILPSTPTFYHGTLNNRYASHGLECPPSSSSAMGNNHVPGNGIWGTLGCPQPSEFVQCLIGVVLLALNTLKIEKIMPTEANIADCIRCGDPKHHNTDVRMALDSAIEQQLVVKTNLGELNFYVGKSERLWNCVNPICGNPKQYSNVTWDGIQKFLTSPAGRSAIMASQSRYEAATVIKNLCLKELALGEVLQILNMVVTIKRWIIHHQSGWQPITIILAETNTDSDLRAGN